MDADQEYVYSIIKIQNKCNTQNVFDYFFFNQVATTFRVIDVCQWKSSKTELCHWYN